MTAASIAPTGTVTRYWKTGIIISRASLGGINAPAPADDAPSARCQSLPRDSVGGYPELERQFLAAMTSLAEAEGRDPVTRVSVDVQVWHGGYDQPAFASQSRYAGWIIVAATTPPGTRESGCLSFTDPRAGSAMTAAPGLPFGRQFVVRPVPGAMAVVPGWLTASVVPLEKSQQLTVAVAAAI